MTFLFTWKIFCGNRSPGAWSSWRRLGDSFRILLLAPFSVGMGPFWKVRVIEISTRDLNFDLLSWFEPLLLGESNRHQSVSIRKSILKTRRGSTQNACCLIDHVLRICFSPLYQVHFAKMSFFENFRPHFCNVFSPHLQHARWRGRKKHRGIEIRFFATPLAHFERGRNFGSGDVSQNSRFYHVLSVSVVPSVSVESVIESVMLW